MRFVVFAFILLVSAGILVFVAPPLANVAARANTEPNAEPTAEPTAAERENAYRANNLGVAQLEQYNHQTGAEAFRCALTLDPKMTLARVNLAVALFNLQDLETARREAEAVAATEPNRPQPHYILGLIAKSQNRAEDALAAFKKVLEIDRNDVGANVNLGQIYVSQRKYSEAEAVFRIALAAEPYNSTAMYALATALLRNNAREEGQQLMTRFQVLRQSGAATNIGQNYLEQGRYAEAIVSTGAESELVNKTAPQVIFQTANIGLPAVKTAARSPKNAAGNATEAAALFDYDNDGDLDLVQLNGTAAPLQLFRNDDGVFVDATRTAGDLAKSFNFGAGGIVAGDYDNDGLADLFVFGAGQNALFHNSGKGVFANISGAAKLPQSFAGAGSGAFVDVDHDGDLDVFLGGYATGAKTRPAANRLWRNNGDGTFTDISEAAKISAPSNGVAVVPTDFDNRRDIDLLVLNKGSQPQLFRNLRDTTFRDVAAEVGLTQTGNWSCAAAGDFNKDSFTDFFFGQADGKGILAVSDGRGKFTLQDAPSKTEKAASAQFLDYDDDGLLDLLVNTTKGLVLFRNTGDGWAEAVESFKTNLNLAASRQILSADLDADGDLDLLIFAKNGALEFLRNDGGSANNSETVRLQGRASNKTGIGAKVDLRSGSLSQKLESYSASPMPAPSEMHFGLGRREKPDAVRVIWASGTVQAEVEFPEKASSRTAKNTPPFKIEELDRKPSSCPYLYTWNGEKFEFITDFLGGGEMGNWQEKGVYHYPDSDEFVRITSDQLKPKNGKYEIRVTNELEEVVFLDHLKLVAVEHDASAEVYPNEGLGIPTAGQKILYTTREAHAPLSAVDSNGKSVLPKIETLDRVFYDDFQSLPIRGYADTHELTLNLDDKKGFDGRTLLLLTGWTDYAFSSDNIAASQSGKSQFLPKLKVRNKEGEWETVIDGIGISVGRPQTLVLDLTGKFLSDSREVRIVTNFKTFWDKIAVDTSEQANVKTIELPPSQANLRTRGFSDETVVNNMIVPDYDKVLNDGRWKYFAGSFTRTGDVRTLLGAIDDTFVISKTGDELVLSFDALPELPANRKYTFLLYADGYSKEMDINSGSPDAVFPLPFKGMTKYPYGADERFPMTAEKRKIYDEYTTRSVKNGLPRLF